MEVDRNGLEVLDREECLRRLRLTTLGRIGFTSGALPRVLPVNFHLDGDRIVVHVKRGSRFEFALHDVVVAFEIDGFDPIDRSGWSVAVTGVATEVSDPAEIHTALGRMAGYWAPLDSDVMFVISTELVSGRRIVSRPTPICEAPVPI